MHHGGGGRVGGGGGRVGGGGGGRISHSGGGSFGGGGRVSHSGGGHINYATPAYHPGGYQNAHNYHGPVAAYPYNRLYGGYGRYGYGGFGLPFILPLGLYYGAGYYPFINYNDVINLNNDYGIESYEVNPNFQEWAYPPNGDNSIVTITGGDGKQYLVHANYNPETEVIAPPIIE